MNAGPRTYQKSEGTGDSEAPAFPGGEQAAGVRPGFINGCCKPIEPGIDTGSEPGGATADNGNMFWRSLLQTSTDFYSKLSIKHLA